MGGAGGGGMAMAAHANAMARPAAHQPPPQGGQQIPGSVAPPVSAAALGADLIDKDQNLSVKQVRNLSHLPIVAVDLYANEPHVALFPPKMEDAPGGSPSLVGKMKADLYLKSNNETAHKTLRKWLTKSKAFSSLQADTLTTADDPNAVRLERPQQWLGLRRIQDAPSFVQEKLPNVEKSTGAISEDTSTDVGVSITNSTLDGSEPQGDDFDRVVCKVRLDEKKKSLAVLPEEGVQILLHTAQMHVAKHTKVDKDNEEIEDYPCAVAVPAWHCNDAAIEALMDGMGGSGVVFQRSICALVGAVRPGPKENSNKLLLDINKIRSERAKAYQIEKTKNADATMVEEVTVVLFGMTIDGMECTAVQVSGLQPENMDCLFGDVKVLCNVSYQAQDPTSIMEKCVKDFQGHLKKIMPDLESPAAIAVYGSSGQQVSMREKWDEIKGKAVDDWQSVPVESTRPDCIAMGTAVLGAVSHGRHRAVVLEECHSNCKKKPKAILAIRVANVAPVAVGIQYNYHGGSSKEWTKVKTVFDFDRRVPAGPYPIDFTASECVVHRQGADGMTDEEFLKAAKDVEGSKGIPQREEAALGLRVQIYEKWTRDGEWKKVGDVKKPLVMENKEGEQVACEHTTLELSLGPTGVITAGLFGEG